MNGPLHRSPFHINRSSTGRESDKNGVRTMQEREIPLPFTPVPFREFIAGGQDVVGAPLPVSVALMVLSSSALDSTISLTTFVIFVGLPLPAHRAMPPVCFICIEKAYTPLLLAVIPSLARSLTIVGAL